MDIITDEITGMRTALFGAGSVNIETAQDALDLITSAKFEAGCSGAVIHKSCFSDVFFDLSSGLAGEILQKFTNYRLRVAIVGGFGEYGSRSLKAFIAESNRHGELLFLDSEDEALEALRK